LIAQWSERWWSGGKAVSWNKGAEFKILSYKKHWTKNTGTGVMIHNVQRGQRVYKKV